jgi:NADH dehydrogenase FAD-containing subunit
VICSGSNYNANEANIEDIALVFSKKERAKLLQKYTDEMDKAKSIMIIGGGATGVECAAEVDHKYGKDKKIGISNNQDRLLAGYPEKASNLATTHFKST